MISNRLAYGVRNQLIRLASLKRFQPAERIEKRIVLVRPDHFGDLLMLRPAVEHLRAIAPDHRISIMIGPWNQTVARHLMPDVDLTFYDFPGFNRNSKSASKLEPYCQISEAAQLLRTMAPQAIVLLRDDHWWGAIMAREAGIPLRIGYTNPLHNSLLTHPVDVTAKHYIYQNIELVRSTAAILGYSTGPDLDPASIGPLHWPPHTAAQEKIELLMQGNDIGDRFIALHPGTGADVKRWPIGRWAALINEFNNRGDRSIVLSGAPEESGLCSAIAGQATRNVTSLAGKTSLFELGELFRRADLVVGVDSGPLHLATATGTPSIHLYGPSDPVRYGPWGDSARHRAIRVEMSCPDCGNLSPTRSEPCGCMTAITVANVNQHVVEMLDSNG
jgi:heptosyltransferase III